MEPISVHITYTFIYMTYNDIHSYEPPVNPDLQISLLESSKKVTLRRFYRLNRVLHSFVRKVRKRCGTTYIHVLHVPHVCTHVHVSWQWVH